MATTERLLTGSYSFPTVKFEKLGSEINNAIDTRLKQFDEIVEASTGIIAALCKDVGLELNEVLVDDSDHVAITGYESKAYSNAPTAATAVRAMETKLAKIRMEAGQINRAKQVSANMARVKKNIDNNRKFDLTYTELTAFGF